MSQSGSGSAQGRSAATGVEIDRVVVCELAPDIGGRARALAETLDDAGKQTGMRQTRTRHRQIGTQHGRPPSFNQGMIDRDG
ncbi:hypothetical protein M2440_004390 [Methylorubrum extorquens]|nr:hypothetical protein [Methylorubrum extorquens]